MPRSKSALMAFLVATVTAEELENPPCGMLPVETSRRPRNASRPRTAWTLAPRFPLRTVRMEAMAFPTSENGRRMLVLTHRDGGGSGCRVLPPPLQLVVGEVAERKQQALGHAGAEALVAVPVGDLFARIHAIVVRGDRAQFLLEFRIGGIQVDLPSSAHWTSTTICSLPAASSAPMGICQAGPKKRPMSGCMKAMRKRPPEMPIGHRLVGLEAEPVFRGGAVQLLQLQRDRGHLARGAALANARRGLFHLRSRGGGLGTWRTQDALQQGQVHRLGHVRAEQIVFRIGDRGRDRADLAALLSDALDDVGQVVLALGVGVGEFLRMAAERRGPDHVQGAVAFGEVIEGAAQFGVRDGVDVPLLDDSQDAPVCVAHDPSLAAVFRRLVDGGQERQVGLTRTGQVPLIAASGRRKGRPRGRPC